MEQKRKPKNSAGMKPAAQKSPADKQDAFRKMAGDDPEKTAALLRELLKK